MALKLVPKIEPSQEETVIERLKRRARPDGALQCNRCGSRTAVTELHGACIKNGRVQGGQVTEKLVCALCYKRGIISPMLPELMSVK
jgi:hypothetical protein